MTSFMDTHVFRSEVFSLGVDRETGAYYLSTPISGATHAVDIEAYYSITDDEYRLFAESPIAARSFTEDCRTGRRNRQRIA